MTLISCFSYPFVFVPCSVQTRRRGEKSGGGVRICCLGQLNIAHDSQNFLLKIVLALWTHMPLRVEL